jgi:hypothetical protein
MLTAVASENRGGIRIPLAFDYYAKPSGAERGKNEET